MRQWRRRGDLFAWAALILAPYAMAIFTASAVGSTRIIAGYIAVDRLAGGLRLVSRSPALRRALGGTDGALKSIHIVVPAIGLAIWWAATVPAGGVPHLPVITGSWSPGSSVPSTAPRPASPCRTTTAAVGEFGRFTDRPDPGQPDPPDVARPGRPAATGPVRFPHRQPALVPTGLYRWVVNPADLRYLRDGDLEAREEYLYTLLDRARDDADEAAVEVLRTLVRNYPDYHRSLYTRAMNQAAVFGDASLEGPLLLALADTRYNCQAWAAMGCAALGIRGAIPGLLALLDNPQWIAREQAVIGLGVLGDESTVRGPCSPPAGSVGLDAPTRRRGTGAASAARRPLPRCGISSNTAVLPDRPHRQRVWRCSRPRSCPGWRPAAADDDPDVRYWAAVALGSTGDERAAPTLQRLLDEDRGVTVFDGYVNVAAKKALRTLRRIQAAIAARN